MNNTIKLLPLMLAVGAALAAQAPVAPQTSAAEQTFRDGWWAESGQNDLDAALRLYLSAAIADGPTAVRGKALLHAGALQQRMGKAEAAVATLRQVLREYGGDAELAARAQSHLRELTAVDLRKNYDEWYERRLFSEETQLQVLAKVQELAEALATADAYLGGPNEAAMKLILQRADTAKAALIGYGKGAVPALRKAAVGRQPKLAHVAIELLFAIGELPPLEALAAGEGFGGETSHWLVMLAQGNRAALPKVTNRGPTTRLVAAALLGPAELRNAIVTTTDSLLLSDGTTVVCASRAVLQHDPGQAEQVLAAIASPDVPRNVRRVLEASLLGDDDRPCDLTAAQWFALGEDPANEPTYRTSIEQTVAKLGPQDGELFDRLLDRVRSALPRGREQLAAGLYEALARHETVERLPWSPARLRDVLTLSSSSLYMLTAAVRADARLQPMLAQALLEKPSALCGSIHPESDAGVVQEALRNHFNDEGDDYVLDRRVQRWSIAMATELATRWSSYDDQGRQAALLILRAAVREAGAHDKLVSTLRLLREGATGEIQAELEAAITAYGPQH